MNSRTDPKQLAADDDVAHLRVPSHSIEAEQSVLGGLLLDNLAWDRAGDLLTEPGFYRHEHRTIFAVISELIEANQPADALTVFERLQARGKADECGGMEYLNALTQSVPNAANLRRYAQIVREHATRRALITLTDEANSIAWNEPDHEVAHERVANLLQALHQHRGQTAPSAAATVVVELIDEVQALADGAEPPGWSTGIASLDRLVGRFVAGLYVLAARPAVGKSSFASHLAVKFATGGANVLLLSLEMNRRQVVRRMAAALGRIPLAALKVGHLSTEEWTRFSEAAERISRLPLYIDDQSTLRLADVRRKARALRPRPDVIIIDYLQRMSGNGFKVENRNLEIEAISSGLKALAGEMDMPVIALAQLNRRIEERQDKRPVLPDLRDSGGIEQDADAVVFLWPVKELPGSGQWLRGCAVAKSRDGECGAFGLAFDGPRQRWSESAESIDAPTRGVSRGGDL